MSQQCIFIKLEGDFIDSFIYSGTLFLVHADSKITTHDWEGLIASALHNNNQTHGAIFEFLKDCRETAQLTNRDSITIHIDKDELEDKCASTLPLDGWPTDINIYTNRLYIASETGVEELPFEWRSRRIEPAGRFHIWRKYAYRVSANDWHRLAIAAGPNGVVTASPRNGYIKEEDIATLLEIDSHDCEWVGRNLVANSLDGAFLSTFPELPKRPQGLLSSSDYWKQLNAIKQQPPETQRVAHKGQNTVVYAWVAGNKLFSLLSTGELSVEQTNEATGSEQAERTVNDMDVEIGMGGRFSNTENVLAARSSLFGTVIEIGDELCTVSEDGIETVSTRPVSWRVFSRARNYLNHLHIIENDQLFIRAYLPSAIPGQTNRFGISIEDVLEN